MPLLLKHLRSSVIESGPPPWRADKLLLCTHATSLIITQRSEAKILSPHQPFVHLYIYNPSGGFPFKLH
jgi:hypothetical protein